MYYQVKTEEEDKEEDIETPSRTQCCICLQPNDATSIPLSCGCGNTFHSTCIDGLTSNRVTTCPLCRKKLKEVDLIPSEIQVVFGVVMVIMTIIIFTTFFCSLVKYIIILAYPSELNYCDDWIKPCDCHTVTSEVYRNTINTYYHDFKIQYELISSYTFSNGTCNNLESHLYNTYEEAFMVSNMSLGREQPLYYCPNHQKCRLNYHWYNPAMCYVNYLSILLLLEYLSMGLLAWIVEFVVYIFTENDRTHLFFVVPLIVCSAPVCFSIPVVSVVHLYFLFQT
jgi:hypothetical protein